MTHTLTAETVADRNQFNLLANEIEGHLLRILSPWQDKKMWKVSGNGGLTVGFKKEVDAYCQSHGYNVEDSRVWLNVFCRFSSVVCSLRWRSATCSFSSDLYLGRIDDAVGTVTHLSDGSKRKTNYTLEGVVEARERAYRLEEQARVLRSSVADFSR